MTRTQFQARRQFLGSGRGKIHFWRGKIFVFVMCLKQIFLGTTQFEGEQKYLGGHFPRMSPVSDFLRLHEERLTAELPIRFGKLGRPQIPVQLSGENVPHAIDIYQPITRKCQT